MKYQKRKYSTPLRPWDKGRIEAERKTLAEFGLRRKKEIGKAQAIVAGWRERARFLAAHHNAEEEKNLIEKVQSLGLITKSATLDNILGLTLEKILDRRLQTLVMKKGIGRTAKHARQLIVHGHVALEGKRIRWPSALIQTADEGKISVYKKIEKAKVEKPAAKAEAPAAPEEKK